MFTQLRFKKNNIRPNRLVGVAGSSEASAAIDGVIAAEKAASSYTENADSLVQKAKDSVGDNQDAKAQIDAQRARLESYARGVKLRSRTLAGVQSITIDPKSFDIKKLDEQMREYRQVLPQLVATFGEQDASVVAINGKIEEIKKSEGKSAEIEKYYESLLTAGLPQVPAKDADDVVKKQYANDIMARIARLETIKVQRFEYMDYSQTKAIYDKYMAGIKQLRESLNDFPLSEDQKASLENIAFSDLNMSDYENSKDVGRKNGALQCEQAMAYEQMARDVWNQLAFVKDKIADSWKGENFGEELGNLDPNKLGNFDPSKPWMKYYNDGVKAFKDGQLAMKIARQKGSWSEARGYFERAMDFWQALLNEQNKNTSKAKEEADKGDKKDVQAYHDWESKEWPRILNAYKSNPGLDKYVKSISPEAYNNFYEEGKAFEAKGDFKLAAASYKKCMDGHNSAFQEYQSVTADVHKKFKSVLDSLRATFPGMSEANLQKHALTHFSNNFDHKYFPILSSIKMVGTFQKKNYDNKMLTFDLEAGFNKEGVLYMKCNEQGEKVKPLFDDPKETMLVRDRYNQKDIIEQIQTAGKDSNTPDSAKATFQYMLRRYTAEEAQLIQGKTVRIGGYFLKYNNDSKVVFCDSKGNQV